MQVMSLFLLAMTRLATTMKKYSKHFILPTRDATDKARQYLRGLLQAGSRKNMYRMAEAIPSVVSRNLQQFLTHSSWDARSVMDHVAYDVNRLLEGHEEIGLFIDESSFVKNGKMSVATAKQWLRHLGKVENGQVAIFGLLSNDRYALPVDCRLFLPEEWSRDPNRCEKAGVPKDKRQFDTKTELAIKIVLHARESGLNFGWIGADAVCGNGPGFCISLAKSSERFMIDVPSDFFVYLENPRPYLPKKDSNVGRPFTNHRTNKSPELVVDIVNLIPQREWRVIECIGAKHGRLDKVYAWRKPVYIWDGKSPEVYLCQLITTKSIDTDSDVTISITNVSENLSLEKIVNMQRQRLWAMRIFENEKGRCGMEDYQARKWKAWHHHMALVMMAMLLVLYRKIKHSNDDQQMSAAEIENLLEIFLPRQNSDENELVSQLENRSFQGNKIASYFHKRAYGSSRRIAK